MSNQKILRKTIDGVDIWITDEHKLPIYIVEHPLYDRFLPFLAQYIKKVEGHLKMIDIGANIGDTFKFVNDVVSGEFLLIEGDKKYVNVLRKNLKSVDNSKVDIEESYCTDILDKNNEYDIVRDNGTAKIILQNNSDGIVNFNTLDSIINKYPKFRNANLLKIDTDGFEIKVIKGGEDLLKKANPWIHIEFTPALYQELGDDWKELINAFTKANYSNFMLFNNFGILLGKYNLDIPEVERLISEIDNNEIYYYDLLIIPQRFNDRIDEVFHEILKYQSIKFKDSYKKLRDEKLELEEVITSSNIKHENKIEEIHQQYIWQLNQLKSESIKLENEVTLKNEKISQIETEYENIKLLYESIVNSFEWTYIAKLRNLKNKVKTKLYPIYQLLKNYFEILVRRIRPRKKIEVNLKAKKILIIDHSYHDKTKSTTFLKELLEKEFQVDTLWDESWINGKTVNLNINENKYVAIIFFQLIPSKQILDTLKIKNIIFIPMYDGSAGLSYDYWKQYENIKILNFSSTLHKKLIKWGLNSIFIQRYPKPTKKQIKGDNNQIFFYNRNSQININTCKKLIGNKNFKIHIHKTMDPGQEFIVPTSEDENKYSITYSDWFEKKEDKWKLARTMGIFIAPRETEGIGQGFLEAMASGMAVIACNRPTMNEYIKDGYNGYLYDFNNINEIDLSNLESVQRNTYKSMVLGYSRWQKDTEKIINFIKQS